jgi:hypothetical protein
MTSRGHMQHWRLPQTHFCCAQNILSSRRIVWYSLEFPRPSCFQEDLRFPKRRNSPQTLSQRQTSLRLFRLTPELWREDTVQDHAAPQWPPTSSVLCLCLASPQLSPTGSFEDTMFPHDTTPVGAAPHRSGAVFSESPARCHCAQ